MASSGIDEEPIATQSESMTTSTVASASPPFAAQARRDDEAYLKTDTSRRSNDAWAAKGGDPEGCVQKGHSRRYRSSPYLLIRYYSSLCLAPGPFGRNADATVEAVMLY